MRTKKRLRGRYIAHLLYGASVSLLLVGSGLAQEFSEEPTGSEEGTEVDPPQVDPPQVDPPQVDPPQVDQPTVGEPEPTGESTSEGVGEGEPASTPALTDKDCVSATDLYFKGCIENKVAVKYTPQFELWSDHADKERYIVLPKLAGTPSAATHIDAANPNRWVFPVGTRFFKTFSRPVNGKLTRIETRIIEKKATEWTLDAYRWSADEKTVEPADKELGEFVDADDYKHRIPSSGECKTCHLRLADKPEAVLGFDAIQLAHDGEDLTLKKLIDGGRLYDSTNENQSGLKFSADDAKVFPTDPTAKAALGYLHGNCSGCHGGGAPQNDLSMWLRVGDTNPLQSNAYLTGACKNLAYPKVAINPHNPLQSAIHERMAFRAPPPAEGELPKVQYPQMPGLATFVVDTDGLQKVDDWIASLPAELSCPSP